MSIYTFIIDKYLFKFNIVTWNRSYEIIFEDLEGINFLIWKRSAKQTQLLSGAFCYGYLYIAYNSVQMTILLKKKHK